MTICLECNRLLAASNDALSSHGEMIEQVYRLSGNDLSSLVRMKLERMFLESADHRQTARQAFNNHRVAHLLPRARNSH